MVNVTINQKITRKGCKGGPEVSEARLEQAVLRSAKTITVQILLFMRLRPRQKNLHRVNAAGKATHDRGVFANLCAFASLRHSLL